MFFTKDKIRLICVALGIIVTYSLMGILVEKLFKSDYEGKKFDFPVAYNFIQALAPMIIAKIVMLITDHPANETPQKFYIIVSIFHFLGGITSKMALTYISYPIHVIGKACQPIPVVICGLLIVRKTYTIQKYIFVLMIVTGMALFLFKDSSKVPEVENLAHWGYLLIGISLLMDGLKGAAQDVMRHINRPSSLNFMFFENAWSTFMMFGILLVTGEGIAFIEFSMRFKVVWLYVGIVMVCSTIGQFFISIMITNFGSLACIITTTMRKFFTVLISVVLFRHDLTARQWIATGIIFCALLLDVFFGRKAVVVNITDEEKDGEKCDNEETNLSAADKNYRRNCIEMNNKINPV